MGTTLIRMPGGAIVTADDADVASLVQAGGEPMPGAAAIDKFGRETTASDPLARSAVDTFSESYRGVREGRLKSYEDEGLQAFGEGIATSLTAGLVGGGDEDVQLRAEVNPIASLAGQATGLIGGAIAGPLAGASGLAARTGTLAAGLAEARGVGVVGRMAIEGAVDGLAYSTMREGIGATVYDKPFSTEAIAMEALTGAGVGAGLGAAIKGAGAIKKALTREEAAKGVLMDALAGDATALPAVPDLEGFGLRPSAIGIDTTAAAPEGVSKMFTSLSASDAPGIKRAISLAEKAPANAKQFYAAMPHMGILDAHIGREWDEVGEMFSDMARTSSTSPQYLKADRTWAQLAEDRRELAQALGIKPLRDGKVTMSNGKSYPTYGKLGEDVFRGKLGGSLEGNEKAIAAYERFSETARRLSAEMEDLRAAGDIWYHQDITKARRRGDSVPTKNNVMDGETLREEADRVLRKELNGYGTDEQHEFMSEIMARSKGTATEKAVRTPNKAAIEAIAKDPEKLAKLKDLLERRGLKAGTLEEMMESSRGLTITDRLTTTIKKGNAEKLKKEVYTTGASGQSGSVSDIANSDIPVSAVTIEEIPGYRSTISTDSNVSVSGKTAEEQLVSKKWNKSDVRPPDIILKSIAAGEPPHIEEILQLSRMEQRQVMKGLSQSDIESLAAEIRSSEDIFNYTAKSKGINTPAAPAGTGQAAAAEFGAAKAELTRSDILAKGIKQSEAQIEKARIARAKAERQSIIGKDPFAAAPGVRDQIDSLPATGSSANPVVDALRRTNLMGLAMAGMFPKMAIAKVVIEKYGAQIARAAELALSSKMVQMTARKLPQLAWATALAPGGSDNDRNLRAVYEASRNPDAFASAVDESIGNISSDNEDKQVEARERVSTQLQWMIRNMPQSLSQLKLVVPPSSISAFNAMVEAWVRPMEVLANGKTAPTAQLNAVKELWPETYQDWLEKLVDGASTLAAEGKDVPRNIGRMLPMASQSWTPNGISILQRVTMEKAQNSGGKPDAEALAPSTTMESMSKNRIELNK